MDSSAQDRTGQGMAPSRPMQRSTTGSSSNGSECMSKCSCGNPLHGDGQAAAKKNKGGGHGGLLGPSKSISSATTIRRQRELREYAVVSRL